MPPIHRGVVLMKETWTDIPGLEGKYQISNMGRYKRLSRYIQRRRLTEEILPLNQSQVREVKERLGRREHVYDIADSMGISRKTVSKIKSGRSYAWAK